MSAIVRDERNAYLDSTVDSKASSEETRPILGYLSSLLPNNPFSDTLRKAADIFDEVRYLDNLK